jgi:Arc/MetJ-type ribon-helix-helix transcriptional regulator
MASSEPSDVQAGESDYSRNTPITSDMNCPRKSTAGGAGKQGREDEANKPETNRTKSTTHSPIDLSPTSFDADYWGYRCSGTSILVPFSWEREMQMILRSDVMRAAVEKYENEEDAICGIVRAQQNEGDESPRTEKAGKLAKRKYGDEGEENEHRRIKLTDRGPDEGSGGAA